MSSHSELFETNTSSNQRAVRIAVEGCGHGTLNNIYSSVATACEAKSWPGVDLLIIGGDFQAVRNSYDMNAMAVPSKYREIGDFHEYYSGKRVAPYLTLFIGGNHEASNHLTELYYGGWVAPKIYYMGAANVLKFGPLRIAGMSGIWKGHDYRKSHHERLPYSGSDVRSVYHVRELDVRKLLQIRTQVDVGLSHDWPEGIQWCGDSKTLFKYKKFLEADAVSGRLGSIAAKQVLQRLRPRYWLSAHLHTKFTAVVDHAGHGLDIEIAESSDSNNIQNTEEIDVDLDDLATDQALADESTTAKPAENLDEIQLDLDDLSEKDTTEIKEEVPNDSSKPDEFDVDVRVKVQHLGGRDSAGMITNTQTQTPDTVVSDELRAQLPDSFKRQLPAKVLPKLPFPKDIQNQTTKFLALDKCLPGRNFLQLLAIPFKHSSSLAKSERPFALEYDQEWLAITRVFAKDLEFGNENTRVPKDEGEVVYRERIIQEEAWVQEHIVTKGETLVPQNFELTAPVYDSRISVHTTELPTEYLNPQTVRFCSLLQIANPLEMSEEERNQRRIETVRLQSGQADRGNFHGRGPRSRGRGRGR